MLRGATNGLLLKVSNQFTLRTSVNLASGQEEKEQTEHEIEANKSDQREDCVSAADHFAIAGPRVKEAVDQPRLAPELRRHPSERVGDVWKGQGKHQNPEEPRAGFEPAAPSLESSVAHQKYKDRAQCDHDVERVVQQLQ